MRLFRILYTAPIFLLLTSCISQREESADVLPYIHEFLSDKNSREYALLKRDSANDVYGDITFLGRSDAADLFATRFAEYDEHDNVDGKPETDMLKDFAGETLSCISENLLSVDPVDSISVSGFRTKAVKSVFAALDTLSYVSLYDSYGLGRKNSSKIFILGSPEHSIWTERDLAYIAGSSGTTLRVISPLNQILDRLFKRHKGKPLRLGIIVPQDGADPKVYEELFRSKAKEFAYDDAECVVYPSVSDSLLYRLILDYSTRPDVLPLDAVLVDDYSLDVDGLRLQQAEMLSIMNESSLTFGRMLSENFDIYDSFQEAANSLYGILRQNNLFTHNISQPQVIHFSSVLRSDESGESVILIPVPYVQN